MPIFENVKNQKSP